MCFLILMIAKGKFKKINNPNALTNPTLNSNPFIYFSYVCSNCIALKLIADHIYEHQFDIFK